MSGRGFATGAASLLGAVLLVGPAWAQQADPARLNALAACSTIEKKSARLACYDAQMGAEAPPPSRPSRRGLEPAPSAPMPAEPAPPSASAAPPVAPPAPSFGGETLRRGRAQRAREVSQMTAHATDATNDGIGHWTVTLDNGERWKMNETSPNYAPPAAGEAVRIRKASLGSYLMDVHNQPSVRVVRIQ